MRRKPDSRYLIKSILIQKPVSNIQYPASSILYLLSSIQYLVSCTPMTQYFKIGKLAASTGLKGELVLQHSLGSKTSLKGLEAIFLEEKKDNFIPYFIQSAKIRSENETVIKLEGIDIMEAARKLTPKEVWITETDFKKFAAKSSPIALLGFMMIDDEDNEIGEITEVIEQPHQVLCTVLIGGKEALIPIHEESLDKVDKKNRRVYVILPDGLLDIYR